MPRRTIILDTADQPPVAAPAAAPKAVTKADFSVPLSPAGMRPLTAQEAGAVQSFVDKQIGAIAQSLGVTSEWLQSPGLPPAVLVEDGDAYGLAQSYLLPDVPAIGKPISPEALTTPKTAAVEGLPAGLAACYGPSPMARLGRLMHEMDRAFSTDQSVALLLRGDKVLARIDDGTLGILKQP